MSFGAINANQFNDAVNVDDNRKIDDKRLYAFAVDPQKATRFYVVSENAPSEGGEAELFLSYAAVADATI